MFTVAVVFFRATSMGQAGSILAGMFGFAAAAPDVVLASGDRWIGAVGARMVVGCHIATAGLRGWDWLDDWAIWRRAATVALALAAIVFSPGFNPAFIYFQF